MVDFSNRKVPVFSNINDIPRVPNNQQAGNGADLIARHNGFVSDVEGNIAVFEEAVTNLSNTIATLGSSSSSSGLSVLTQDTTWYVDSVNGNDANEGLTETTAFATLVKASQSATSFLNPQGFQRTISLLPGNHNGGALSGFFAMGMNDFIKIAGTATNKSDVKLGYVDCVQISSPGIYYFDNLTFQNQPDDGTTDFSVGNSICVDMARIKIGAVAFGATLAAHIAAYNQGVVEVLNDYEIVGGATYHIFLDAFSFMDTTCAGPSRNISILNNPNFNTFAMLARNSFLSAAQIAINGLATGKKYEANDNSTIKASFFGDDGSLPGDLAGELFTGSQYHA